MAARARRIVGCERGIGEARMKRLVAGMLLAMAAIVLRAQPAAALSSGECADLSIRVKTPPAESSMRCGAKDFGGGGDQGSGRDEFIEIMGTDSITVVSHSAAGTRTYMLRLGVKEVMHNYRIFESTDNWGDETESGRFTLRRFDATLKGSGTKVRCIGFVHFTGHVANTTGYRHLIGGYSCSFGPTPPADSRIDALVSGIDYDFE